MKTFGDIMFTPRVQAEQAERGSRDHNSRLAARPAPEVLGEDEIRFIETRGSFYMATVSETGWPYIQHRGGAAGFLKVIGPTTIGFADYRGNRQYVSTGNLRGDDRVSLFLMDYPARGRLKILGRARVVEAADDPALADRLATDLTGRVERLFVIEVAAFDWNCNQFILPRYSEAEIAATVGPRIAALEARNQALEAQLAALNPTPENPA